MSEISTAPSAEQPEEEQPRQSKRALLFRPAALEFRQHQWLGEVVLTGSARSLTTSIVFFAIATAVVLFLIFGEYTRKEEVQGRVMIDNGAAEIFAPTVGTVIRVLVNEGDVVNVGQPLVVVSTERTIAGGNSRQQIGVELNARRSSLESDSRHIQSIFEQNIAMLRAKATELSAGIQHLDTEITTRGAIEACRNRQRAVRTIAA